MNLPRDHVEDPQKNASFDASNINHGSGDLASTSASDFGKHLEVTALVPEGLIDSAALGSQDYENSLVATQARTESSSGSSKLEMDEDLVGCLIPASENCPRFDLSKSKENKKWKLGRHATNDLVLPDIRISNFHCTLRWNGIQGKKSEVVLADSSFNGTWVNDRRVPRGQKTLLKSGAVISLGGKAHGPNVWRCIFRDIEGQSARHMDQIWAKYEIGHELGVGAFARVHKCMERTTGDEYAVKIIDKSKVRRLHTSNEAVGREISILKQLAEFRHENVVSLREHFEEEDAIYLILELVGGGDLLTYIDLRGPIPEQQVRRMAAQICHAVAYIHSQGIAHRDLKPENVLLTATDPPNCMVADFGLAKLVDEYTFLKTMCGTPTYLAPEVVQQGSPPQGYDNRVDSWSLGVIFYRMLTNHAPFDKAFNPKATKSERDHYLTTRRVNWQRLSASNLSEASCDFLRHLLVEEPHNRKEVLHMLDHHWIAALLPSDPQFQHPPLSSCPRASPPTMPDPVRAPSRSFESQRLSEISIPGLNTLYLPAVAMSINPDARQLSVGSFASEMSVDAKIPSVFPVSQQDKRRRPLSSVEQANAENSSGEFAVPGLSHLGKHRTRQEGVNEPGPSRRTPSLARTSTKRKRDSVEDCSSHSSLCSLPDGDEVIKEKPEGPVAQRAVAPRHRSVAMEPPTHKRARRR